MYKKSLLLIFISNSIYAAQPTLPTPLEFVKKQGGVIVESFNAPANITGYVIDFRGSALTVYLTADKQYLLTGKMIDAQGRDVGETALDAYVTGPKSEKSWQDLSSSNWVLDGKEDAERIIYTFTDPNCPYCKRFWQAARPWVESGKVQIRHILVGILKVDSYGKAAAILAADNSAEALHEHEASLESALRALASPPLKIRQTLEQNHNLMKKLGISATPAIYYKDDADVVKLQMGLPGASQMSAIFDSAKD